MAKNKNKSYEFHEVPLRSQWGIKSMDHYCMKCGKYIGKQEATDSSMKIRKLCKGESKYLWDVWVTDFCADCADEFNNWNQFVDFIKEKNERS